MIQRKSEWENEKKNRFKSFERIVFMTHSTNWRDSTANWMDLILSNVLSANLFGFKMNNEVAWKKVGSFRNILVKITKIAQFSCFEIGNFQFAFNSNIFSDISIQYNWIENQLIEFKFKPFSVWFSAIFCIRTHFSSIRFSFNVASFSNLNKFLTLNS